MSTATELFDHIAEWRVVVCRDCRHAVWPREIVGHLTGRQHKQSRKEAEAIAEIVQSWHGVSQYPSQFQVPTFVAEPIPQLPLFDDGLQCRLEARQCQYIARDMRSMKKHWRTHHGWSAGRIRGGSGLFKQENVQQRTSEGVQQVHCQRFFPSRSHSQYFEVRVDDSASRDEPDDTRTDIWTQAWQQASQRYEEDQNASTIQAGEADEVNPWLRRTGWVEYLAGCQPKDLLQSTQEPIGEDSGKRAGEPVAAAIWDAIGEVAAASQDTVKKSGVMLRFEAVRTEYERDQYHPLEAYRDHTTVKKHCRPWRQMVMFFVRTQQPHEWRSPPYRFNRRQQTAFDRMVERARQWSSTSEDGSDGEESDTPRVGRAGPGFTRLQEACLRFCIELLNQTMYSHETDMALVCALAVIGVSPKGVGFQGTASFPSTLSAIIKVAHFMVVQQAHIVAKDHPGPSWEAESSPCDLDDGGSESERAPRRTKTRSGFQWVKRMMGAFMFRGTGSPTQWMLDLRAYGMKVDYNTTSAGHVSWKDGDVLQYKDIHFSMADFRGMAHQLEASTREALRTVMFARSDDDIPAVPWQQLFDDPSNASVGWSFVDDTRIPWPVDGKEWMSQRIQQRPEQRRRFVSETAATGMRRSAMQDWLREVDDFRGRLLALMHITGGQPARGPEILSVRHSNTVQGGHRNLFIEDGMVVFVTHYHKGEHYHGDVKIVHRYLPREVGELVVWYAWLVVPFVQRIKRWLWPQSPISQHIWGPDVDGRRWTTDRLKQYLQQATEAGLGHAIHVAAYRHIAIAISREWARAGKAIHGDDDVQDEDDIGDEQATHSPFTAGAVYAREIDELPGSTASRRQQFRAASVEWHRILGFQCSVKQEVRRGFKREGDALERYGKRSRVERAEQLRQMDAQAEMSWMMRQEVTLRSVQQEAFQAIQRGDGKIVVVMPTGAGKSILFMLPAFIGKGSVTVVVVPLLALRHDLVARCHQVGIRAAEWEGGKSVDGASIVLVTPEATAADGFQTFLRRLKQTQQLDRIVIDECHVLLSEGGSFRSQLPKLGRLVSAHTQMLLLTATLPPTEEHILMQRMFWERHEVTVTRGSTVRPNIAYGVIDGAEGLEGQVQQLADIVVPSVRAGEKAVVLCDDIKRINAIVEAGLFPCEAFHAGLSSQVRGELLSAYKNGQIPVLVATSTFGLGVDIPDIRLFVHVTMPDNMREYAQSSGRAGRDGQPSRAIIIRGPQRPRDSRMQAYIDGQQCRRVGFDGYLDGDTERIECQGEERPCDSCERRRRLRSPTTAAASRDVPVSRGAVVVGPSALQLLEREDRDRGWPDERRREGVREQRSWQQAMQRRLQQWKGRCAVCYSLGGNDAHPVSQCPNELGKKADHERRLVQRDIRYPQGHVCYRCGVPRVICSRWSADGQVREGDEGAGCQFYGVLIGVVYTAKHAYPQVWGRWFDVARRDPAWPGTMAKFLGSSILQGEGYGCQIGRAFMWITEEIDGLGDPPLH